MSPKEAFRIGFLARCVDDGLSPQQTHERIEKIASSIEKQAFMGLGSGLGKLTNMGLMMGAVAPIGVGALGGYLAHNAVEDTLDEDDVKKEELISELKHWARRAREQKKTRLFLGA